MQTLAFKTKKPKSNGLFLAVDFNSWTNILLFQFASKNLFEFFEFWFYHKLAIRLTAIQIVVVLMIVLLTSSFSAQKVSQSAERLENIGFCF